MCGPYDGLSRTLGAQYGEAMRGAGISSDGRRRVEIWRAVDGASWSVVVVRVDGIACLVASGPRLGGRAGGPYARALLGALRPWRLARFRSRMKAAVNGMRRTAPWVAIVAMVALAGAAGAIRLGAAEQQVRTNATQIEDTRQTERNIMAVLGALQAQQERIDERTRAIQARTNASAAAY